MPRNVILAKIRPHFDTFATDDADEEGAKCARLTYNKGCRLLWASRVSLHLPRTEAMPEEEKKA